MSRRARKGRDLDGILVIDKPAGLTSNAILQRVKHLLGAAKAGHTGSLDPLATGVLPLCFGEATKFSQWLLEADKTYRATGRLGITTDSGDSDGQILEARPVPDGLDSATLEQALVPLRGEIDQVPPMVSALKHQGQRLYKLARQGKQVERKARRVQIKALTLVSLVDDEFEIDVHCSKGTYVRSLIESIGETLGCGAHVTALRRTRAASFTLADAVSMDDLEPEVAATHFDSLLLPIDRPLETLPAICMDAEHCVSILNGQPVRISGQANPGQVRLYGWVGSLDKNLDESLDESSAGSNLLVSKDCPETAFNDGKRLSSGMEKVFLGLGEVMLDGQVRPRRLVNAAKMASKGSEL